jgi:superfamily I DNA and/or RNA helicase
MTHFKYMLNHQITFSFVSMQDIEPDFLWTEWALGKPCPEWIQVYMHLDPDLITFWSMSAASRMDRIKDWHNEILQDIRDELKDAVSTYDELTKEKTLIIREKDLNILKSARIIGATTSGAAQYKDILSAKSPGVVIVEEAGEVLEPHILASLSEDTLSSSETKHLILIGDHLQLRPKLENYRLSTVSGAGYNFDCSMFERLIKRNYPSSMLQVQHRMRPQISELIRQETYPTLKDHSSVFEFPSISGMSHDIVFVDHDQKEDGIKHAELELQMTTKSNNFEARYCIEFVRYLLLQGYAHEQITILTPYVGQVVKIAQSMKTLLKDTDTYISDLDMREIMGDDEINMNFSTKKSGVRCASVDNFQG